MAAYKKAPQRVKKILSSFLVPAVEKRVQKGSTGEDDDKLLLSDHWDKDAFNRRVESFTISFSNWLAKPSDISPLACARYGWESTGADVMKCVSCKAILFGQLPKWKNDELYQECHMKLKTSLVESHKGACPWRNNPSPASFLTIYFENREETLRSIQETLEDFVDSCIQLPVLSFETLHGIGLDEITFHDRATQVYQTMVKLTDFNLTAFSLALFGWKRSPFLPQVIVCERCRRQVGLWSFRCAISRMNGSSSDTCISYSPEDRDTNGYTNCDTTPEKNTTLKAKKIKLEGFDPIGEHKGWCPWVISPGDQAQQGSLTPLRTPTAHLINSTEVPEDSNRLKHPGTDTVSSYEKPNLSSSSLLNESDSGATLINYSSVSEDSNHSLQNSQSSSSPGHELCDFSPGQPINFTAFSQEQLPPWQMLLLLLSLWKPENTSSEQQDLKSSPPLEGLRHVRRIIRKWSSPVLRRKMPRP